MILRIKIQLELGRPLDKNSSMIWNQDYNAWMQICHRFQRIIEYKNKMKLENNFKNIYTHNVCVLTKYQFVMNCLGTMHLRRRQIFTIFYPYPPPSALFLLLFIRRQIRPIFDPSPLRNTDVLNGWSPSISTRESICHS